MTANKAQPTAAAAGYAFDLIAKSKKQSPLRGRQIHPQGEALTAEAYCSLLFWHIRF